MRIEPLTGTIGAKVFDFDSNSKLDEDKIIDLRKVICQYEVVIIESQNLSPESQVAFSHRLGPYSPVPFIQPLDDHPEVIKVVKEASEPNAFNFGGVWHSDFSFLESPPSFTILYAIDVPKTGGDTVWSSMTSAYSALDPTTKERLKKITAIHSAEASYSPSQQNLHSQLSNMDIRTSEKATEFQEHPLICKHPETKKCTLFFNPTYVRSLKGPGLQKSEEKKELLKWLNHWSTSIQFTFRHRWKNRDLVIWDNRSTQHIALNDYKGNRRELHRTTVSGNTPSF